jgi:hypothetical protein
MSSLKCHIAGDDNDANGRYKADVKSKVRPMTRHEGPENIYSFFNIDAMEGGCLTTRTRSLTPGNRSGTHCTRPVWKGKENLAPAWVRTPDRPARSDSVYQGGYSGF